MPTWEQGINQKTGLGTSKSPEEQQKCPVWILTPLLSQTEQQHWHRLPTNPSQLTSP